MFPWHVHSLSHYACMHIYNVYTPISPRDTNSVSGLCKKKKQLTNLQHFMFD